MNISVSQLYKKQPKKKKNLKVGRWILFLLVIFFGVHFFAKPIALDQDVVLQKGDTVQKIFDYLSGSDRLRIKMYIKSKGIDFSGLEPGSYTFEGKYSKHELIDKVLQGPTQEYTRYTILEGRSMYDIDYDLVKKGFIQPGEYISFISDENFIASQKTRYEFLSLVPKLDTLEGFLYPDTYNVDVARDFLDQLVALQLKAFNQKVRIPYQEKITSFKLDRYKTLILASIVEKEEKQKLNKPTVAGIFLNRIDNGMRLDADITLCYGLQKPYETCTPKLIANEISDKNNIYNTRQQAGIPPKPISNPSTESISAVLNYKDTEYFYYLHDMHGNIYYGKTISEHNRNKELYLR